MPSFNYDDIINLPYPRNDWNFLMKHPRMSVENRAKIFSPFAALRGHKDAIDDTAERNLTVRQEDLMDDSRYELDETLGVLVEKLSRGEHPVVRVTHFVQDAVLAQGIGTYQDTEGMVSRLDLHQHVLVIVERKINLSNIQKIILV